MGGVSRRQILRETGMHRLTLNKILEHSDGKICGRGCVGPGQVVEFYNSANPEEQKRQARCTNQLVQKSIEIGRVKSMVMGGKCLAVAVVFFLSSEKDFAAFCRILTTA